MSTPTSAPTLDEQRAFYDEWNRHNRAGGFGDIDPRVAARAQVALEHIASMDLPPDARILEIGCGTGWLAEKLADFGQVTAIDLSPGAIEIAKQRNLPIDFIADDFMSMGDRLGGPFDLVVAAETFFYVEDQPTFVDRMAEVSKPDARLVMTTINRYVYERMGEIEGPAHGQIRNWRDRKECLALFARHYTISKVESVFPGGDQGLLRFVNSVKLNGLAEIIFSAERLRRWKEKLGFGVGFVFVGRLRG